MSSDDIAIRVLNLCKSYQIYEVPRDRLKQFVLPRLQRLAGQAPKQYYREFRALNDVSLEVRRGETVGIIGRNGSGKSTLLQIICGTLTPTGGTVETRGRIAALLELGSGFNPDFTGRENVYLNAAVLGLPQEEIETRFDAMAAFADIGDFIDQPVKTYSSGMVVRLAFAVAINVDPDILIIDEALSVGDELFQRKCFSRIEAIRATGATILFVSHAGSTIVELCDRAVLMDAGERLATGLPKQIVGRYQKLLYAPAEKRDVIRNQIRNSFQLTPPIGQDPDEPSPETESTHRQDAYELRATFDPNLKPSSTIRYEPRGALIEDPRILTLKGEEVNNLIRGKPYRYVYTVRFTDVANNVRFGMLIKTIAGVELGGAESTVSLANAIPLVESGERFQVEFRFNAYLNTGVYFMNAGVLGQVGQEDGYLHRLIDIAMFRILPSTGSYATAIVDFGCVPEIGWIES
jgi:lipopolysaccharide transport system ATP-binding protein